MLPDPLHPAVVHFPVVLAVLLPIFAAVALFSIRRGTPFRRAWAAPVALVLALAASSWVAVQTGEGQEERIERVVAEPPLEAHEEAAELFLTLTAALALVVVAGLARGRIGGVARVAGTAGAIALVTLAAWVGHTGGELVYRHGAASAYADPASPASPAATSPGARADREQPRAGRDRDSD